MNRPSLSAMIVAKPFLPDASSFDRSWSEDAADYSAFGSDGGAVNGNGLRAGYECDHRGDFLGSFKAFKERTGPHTGEELLFNFGYRNVLLFGHIFQEAADAFGGGGTGQNGIDGYAGASDGLGEAARDCDLRGFGHAVVNHFGGNVLGGFAGDKNDASPIFL